MPSKPNLLYLEDDMNLGTVTCNVLSKEGFEVTWITNGEDGLDAFQKTSFDLCIVDIMMPKLDGYSLVKAIRSANSDIPVIFLSARVLTEDVLKGFQVGADDYIRKPFSIEELVARINRLLQNRTTRSTSESSILKLGSFTYNHHTFELKDKEGKSTHLSPRAGELLYRLITNTDHILPKKETLLELWGDDSFFNGRSMDVFISKIRKQLSADPSIRIVNIRAQGYKLIY